MQELQQMSTLGDADNGEGGHPLAPCMCVYGNSLFSPLNFAVNLKLLKTPSLFGKGGGCEAE